MNVLKWKFNRIKHHPNPTPVSTRQEEVSTTKHIFSVTVISGQYFYIFTFIFETISGLSEINVVVNSKKHTSDNTWPMCDTMPLLLLALTAYTDDTPPSLAWYITCFFLNWQIWLSGIALKPKIKKWSCDHFFWSSDWPVRHSPSSKK